MWSGEIQGAVHRALVDCVKRRRLVFVQANPAVEVVLQEAIESGAFTGGRLGDPLGGPNPLLLASFGTDILEAADPGAALGMARESVLRLLDEGRDVCLVSAAPRIAFPQCPGSSLLEDAYVFHPDSAARSARDSAGENADDLRIWPADVDAELLDRVIDSLGLDVLACLDYLLFDLQQVQGIALELVSNGEWEALRGSGLVSIDIDRSTASFDIAPAALMPRVAEAISRSLGVQASYPQVATTLVDIERRLRRCLRVWASAAFGDKWKGQALVGNQGDRVLDRVTADVGMRPPSVRALRDPLEWLSLGELLEIVQTAGWAQRLGHEREFWIRFTNEVMPIRNRISHMRLLRRGDLERVRYWCLALSRTLDTSIRT